MTETIKKYQLDGNLNDRMSQRRSKAAYPIVLIKYLATKDQSLLSV